MNPSALDQGKCNLHENACKGGAVSVEPHRQSPLRVHPSDELLERRLSVTRYRARCNLIFGVGAPKHTPNLPPAL